MYVQALMKEIWNWIGLQQQPFLANTRRYALLKAAGLFHADVEDWVERYFLLKEARSFKVFCDYEKLLSTLADSIEYDIEGSQHLDQRRRTLPYLVKGQFCELIDSEEQFTQEEIDIEDVLNDVVNRLHDDYLVVDDIETDNLDEDELEDGGILTTIYLKQI